MDHERDPGATFALEDIGWIDFETRGRVGIEAGTYRYAGAADAIVLAYAIGTGPAQTVTPYRFDRPLALEDMPVEILRHHAKVENGTAVWAAWNAGFDKAVWNYSTVAFPLLEPRMIIDVMAQAGAAGLPADLEGAAQRCGAIQKLHTGKELIKLFCLPESTATPQSYPLQWARFLDYARFDIEAMRSVFLHTHQLARAEWEEYWAMEAINERGVGIDLKLATAAARLAVEDRQRSCNKLKELTGGAVYTPDQVQRITKWLLERLPAEGREILTKREEEIDEDGVITKVAKHALTRRQVERLIAMCSSMTLDPALLQVLQIRLYGGSKTPAKFSKMLQQQIDGMLLGQYVFNGAPQTGRASSKGVQIHNLARDPLPYEYEAIDSILTNGSYAALERIGDDSPVARKLSLLIRPTFIPRGDNVFVWSDWSQIEARVLPWLADYDPEAAMRLQIFRDVDKYPELPDLYTRTAAELSHVSILQVTKAMRQRGKVAELALGYCGGVNALLNMAAGYGLHFSHDEAQAIVDRWRAVNPWAIDYSRKVWETMRLAKDHPGTPFRAGRVHLVFEPTYLGGSLRCILPSLRILTYRAMRWDEVDVELEDGTTERRVEMMFSRGHGRTKLWPGLFVENFTQAVAADVLRGTLRRLEALELGTRLHTHDEIVLECGAEEAGMVRRALRGVMQHGFDWSEGLPLMSEETMGYCYTKNEREQGL